jgi:hypothetical protein
VNSAPQNPNAGLLSSAVHKLAPILDRIVFVGGCATGLLITDPAAAPIRPTLDVDVIVDLASYADLIAIEGQLEQLGFRHVVAEGAPLCRWILEDLVLDLMPTDPLILGFSNRWYRQAMQEAVGAQVGDCQIRLITAPCFLATKLEAFFGRGRRDFRMSRDLEDMIAVLDGRPEIVAEFDQTDPQIRQYVRDEFFGLLGDRDFLECLPGYLLPDFASQQRIRIVIDRMRQIAQSTGASK